MKKFLAMLTMVAILGVSAIGCSDDKKPAVKDTVKDTVKDKVKDTVKDKATTP
jgi:hypothetical protein